MIRLNVILIIALIITFTISVFICSSPPKMHKQLIIYEQS